MGGASATTMKDPWSRRAAGKQMKHPQGCGNAVWLSCMSLSRAWGCMPLRTLQSTCGGQHVPNRKLTQGWQTHSVGVAHLCKGLYGL